MTKITIDTGRDRRSTSPRGKLVTCSACRGTGIDALGYKCPGCGGTGRKRM